MRNLDKIKQYGFRRSLARLMKSILRDFGLDIDSYIILVNKTKPEKLRKIMQKHSYDEVQKLSLHDFYHGDPDIFNEEKIKLIHTRFNGGEYWSYGILDKDKLVYSCWISTKNIKFPPKYNRDLPLQSNEGFLEDAYCHPEYRGKGLHSRMNLYRLAKLHEKGKTRNFVIVLSENVPAMKSQLKAGFIKYRKVTFMILFGKTYVFEKTYK